MAKKDPASEDAGYSNPTRTFGYKGLVMEIFSGTDIGTNFTIGTNLP
jgi:hypothetical protein